MYIAGVDEAGRGPVLGPMVIAGVVISSDTLGVLSENGLTDSKLLSVEKREELYAQIMDTIIDSHIIVIPAEEIDQERAYFTSLNKLELKVVTKILQLLEHWETAYVDACDVSAERFERNLQVNVPKKVIAQHKADVNFPIVSAASILAKVTRDRAICSAHDEFGVDFGSGYCHDPKTIRFLNDFYKENQALPKIARKSWVTSKRIIYNHQQSNINDFFNQE
ncbi:MAG: ribonuclease HII [Asgard group archaeon]|nr:ribonuclease HII [Asgard group archaeon]